MDDTANMEEIFSTLALDAEFDDELDSPDQLSDEFQYRVHADNYVICGD